MRVFIALELPESVKDSLLICQKSIIEIFPVGNYSLVENFHVTLKFIGDVGGDDLKVIMNCMEKAAKDFFGFEIKICGLGLFSKGIRSIIWAKVIGNSSLHRLFGDLEDFLVNSGFKGEDRLFRPHITLGRNILTDGTGISNIVCDIISFRVGSICLMESRRVDGVLRYVPIYRVYFSDMRD